MLHEGLIYTDKIISSGLSRQWKRSDLSNAPLSALLECKTLTSAAIGQRPKNCTFC